MSEAKNTEICKYKPVSQTGGKNFEVEINIKEFLDFLSVAYKVSNILENETEENSFNNNSNFDWSQLTSNKLLSRLFNSLLFENLNVIATVESKPRNNVTSYEEKREPKEAKNDSLRTSGHSMIRSKSTGNIDTNKIVLKRIEMNKIKVDHKFEENFNNIETLLQNKLNEVLSEGIFDSILFVPQSSVNATQIDSKQTPKPDEVANTTACSKTKRKERKKKSHGESSKNITKLNNEIEIHVYDEVKGYKTDFKCPQHLLISNMGYFLEVTKGQKLEEMDISVHCDVTIFEWLMKWIKHKDVASEQLPVLDPKNVIPIMISANFLQMQQLFKQCLKYCKSNINHVVRYSPNLSCLSDNILKRLADLLSNIEVQSMKDKKDKVKSKLFCKLIMSLNELIPEKHRGHYASLAYLYFCLYCGKLVSTPTGPYIPCQLRYITIKYNGDVMSNHFRDPKWNLNEYIKKIWIEHKNWGNTYWRLWSQCHFLFCNMCRTMYAVEFADCCPYHPQQPHFYPMEQFQTTNSPIGRYPCCGSKAVRYQTIMIPSGCKLRSHIPKLQSNDDTSIQNILNMYPDLIKKSAELDIQNLDEDGLKQLTGEITDGPLLLSEFNEDSLLSNSWYTTFSNTKKLKSNVSHDQSVSIKYPPETATDESANCYEYSSVGESENSDFSLSKEQKQSTITTQIDINPTKPASNETRPMWLTRYSIRHNQDNQREYEEVVFKAMSDMLLQNMESTSNSQTNNKKSGFQNSYGGTYPQIEADWKELHKGKIQGVKKTFS